jgi:lysozyme family protein
MADFAPAFEEMIRDEGGYQLTDIPGDNGGQTYAGIARKPNPNWAGWAFIDRKETPPSQMVRDFYKAHFWDDIRGDQLSNQKIATCIFNFYVNTGRPAKTIAQLVVGATPDGVIGEATVGKLNAVDTEKFIMAYTLGKIARYAEICNRNRDQSKFLLGWLNRALKGAK